MPISSTTDTFTRAGSISSKDILDLIGSPARNAGMHAGKVRYLREVVTRGTPGQHTPGNTEARKWLDSMVEQPHDTPAAVYHDPTNRPVRTFKTDEPLGPSDHMWLSRLPTDPAKVTAEDAATLAGMAGAVKKASSDGRLVHSIYAPVKRYHELKAAEVELAEARRPLPPAPPGALTTHNALATHGAPGAALATNALAAALRRETPELNDFEALTRAETAIRETIAARDTAHAARVARLQARVAELRGDPQDAA